MTPARAEAVKNTSIAAARMNKFYLEKKLPFWELFYLEL